MKIDYKRIDEVCLCATAQSYISYCIIWWLGIALYYVVLMKPASWPRHQPHWSAQCSVARPPCHQFLCRAILHPVLRLRQQLKGWHTDSRVVLRAVNEPSQIFTVCFGRFVQLRSLKLPVFWSLWTSIPILCLLTVSRCQHNVLIDSYLNCESTSKRSQQGEGLLPTCTVKSSWIFVDSSIGAVWLWRDPVKPRGLMTRPTLANIG